MYDFEQTYLSIYNLSILFLVRLNDADNVIKVTKGSPDNWMPICSYGFKSIYSDEICKLLGHNEAIGYDVKVVTDQQFAVFNISISANNLLEQLLQTT